jgi:dipeptidyl aminopeptidase/acylaminoacyl peptidase
MPCHNKQTHTEGLVLETYQGLMKGTEHGRIVVPGKSAKSDIVLHITGAKKPKMPPTGKGPSAKEVALLRAWIDAGAKPDAKKATDDQRPRGRRTDTTNDQRATIGGSPGPSPRGRVRPPVGALAWAPGATGRSRDGATGLLAVGSYREVLLLDPMSGRTRARLFGPAAKVTSVAFSPDGRRLAAAGGAPGQFGEIWVWEMAGPAARPGRGRVLRGHDDVIYAIAFSPNGRTLAAGSYDRRVSLWPVTGGAPHMLRDHIDAVYDVAFSPDGRWVASASGDRTVKVWEVATGKRLFTLTEPTAELYTVAFHPSGKQLAAAGVDKMVRTWNLTADGGMLARSAFAHDGAVLALAYSKDGGQIVTTAEDRTVRLWDAATLTERRVLERQSDWAPALALSPDGRLACGRHDGIVALYDTASGRRLAATTLAAR